MGCTVLESLQSSSEYARRGAAGLPRKCQFQPCCDQTPDGCLDALGTPLTPDELHQLGEKQLESFYSQVAITLAINASSAQD